VPQSSQGVCNNQCGSLNQCQQFLWKAMAYGWFMFFVTIVAVLVFIFQSEPNYFFSKGPTFLYVSVAVVQWVLSMLIWNANKK
jgi:hypothetical protein